MSSTQTPEEIFNKAVEIANAAKQAAYLDEACGGDEKLRTKVEELLKWNQEAGSFLDLPNEDPNVTLDPSGDTEGSGTVIGRYKLLEQVGEGGMATVYMAEQKRPIRRRVALKIIKLGMDTKQVIGRFEAERQALAMMDHPNIAKVLDAGTTDTGRPYFVMELVRGEPITKFCDSNHLTTKERINLFVQVCQAVQHAHQRGVIHRDIKPSNVLVTLHDGQPVPKVIDFGIAKAVNQQLTEKTVFTRYAQMIGTPEYMSPEQAEMSGLDIDTRTDVFSLGVLLYELLTGSTPFDAEYLLAKGYGEMQRIIREEEPTRPSTKISTLGQAVTDIAKSRRTSPELLCKLIRTDLDWIVMKTLEKDRSRRYESVSELAADVKRHLDHEPVLAGRPSLYYRVQKFTRRNKTLCASAVAIAAILVLAAIVSAHQAIEAHHAKNAERAARTAAEAHAEQEKLAKQEAQENLYDSLIREARATRIAREVGYRDQFFKAIQDARNLDVKQKDLTELRKEAAACMGDFVGLQPNRIVSLPSTIDSPLIWFADLHPTDPIAAFALTDGTILIRELTSGKIVASLEGRHHPRGLRFASNGNALISLHVPNAYTPDERRAGALIQLFIRAQDSTWVHSKTMTLPFARKCISTTDGFRVLVANSASQSAQVIDPVTREIVHQFSSQTNANWPPVIDLTSDGRFLAAATPDPANPSDSLLTIYDLLDGSHSIPIKPGLAECTGLNFSPDGVYLAYQSRSGCIIYSTSDAQVLGRFPEQFLEDTETQFIPGTSIFTFATGQLTYLWDLNRNEYVATLKQPLGGAFSVCISNDGHSLMTWGDHDAWLYALEVNRERLTLPGHDAGVPGIAFSPDGLRLASVGKDKMLRVWNSITGNLEWNRQLKGQGQGVTYSSDGKWLVTTDFDRARISIWNTKTLELQHELGAKHRARTWWAQFTMNGEYLLAAMERFEEPGQGSLTVWKCEDTSHSSAEPRLKLEKTNSIPGDIVDLALSPNDRLIAFVCFKGPAARELYQWDILEMDAPVLVSNDSRSRYTSQVVSFSGDCKELIFADANGSVVTHSISTGQRRVLVPSIHEDHKGRLSMTTKLCLKPSGDILAVTTPLGSSVDLWHLPTGKYLYQLPGQHGRVYRMAWSPDGSRLAVSRANGKIEIWNLAEINNVLAGLGLQPQVNVNLDPSRQANEGK